MSYVRIECPACGDPVRQPLGVHRAGDTLYTLFHRRRGEDDCRIGALVTSTGGVSTTVLPSTVSAESILVGSTLTGGFAEDRSTG